MHLTNRENSNTKRVSLFGPPRRLAVKR